MLNEKPHKDADWKRRIGEPGNFPGEVISDNDAAWNKLHHRLHTGKTTRKAVWYWIAATSLLIITMLPLVTRIQDDGHRTAKIPVKDNKVTVVKSLHSTKKTPDSLTDAIAKQVLPQKKIIVNITKPQYKPANSSRDSRPGDSIKSEALYLDKHEDIATMVLPPDTIHSVVTTVSIKKKIKVVHINELGQPVEENYKGRYADHQVIHLKLNSQDNLPYLPGTTPTLTQDLLKIKFTPQN